jgi:hypothetical protein
MKYKRKPLHSSTSTVKVLFYQCFESSTLCMQWDLVEIGMITGCRPRIFQNLCVKIDLCLKSILQCVWSFVKCKEKLLLSTFWADCFKLWYRFQSSILISDLNLLSCPLLFSSYFKSSVFSISIRLMAMLSLVGFTIDTLVMLQNGERMSIQIILSNMMSAARGGGCYTSLQVVKMIALVHCQHLLSLETIQTLR